MANPLLYESVWFDKWQCEQAETQWHILQSRHRTSPQSQRGEGRLVDEIVNLRQSIRNSLDASPLKETSPATCSKPATSDVVSHKLTHLEEENKLLNKRVHTLESSLKELATEFQNFKKIVTQSHANPAKPTAPTAIIQKQEPDKGKEENGKEDDFELFGSDEEEDAEAERLKAERIKLYAEKKSKKEPIIAKSSILLDVKPWDDETDMVALEAAVRSVSMDGLLWGASKLVPLAYGIHKLQISCVVEDDKVGTDDLEENITKFEEYVQSVDIAAFNKI